MATKESLNRELDDFERALATLTPNVGGVNRDQLMFLAGQRSATATVSSAGSPRWYWPASLAFTTTVAAVLLTMLLLRPERVAVERIVYVPDPAASISPVDKADIARDVNQAADAAERGVERIVRSVSRPAVAIANPPRRSGPSAAGPHFRLFDHLLAESTAVEIGAGVSSTDQMSGPGLSRRSLDELLEESAAARSPALRSPGANL